MMAEAAIGLMAEAAIGFALGRLGLFLQEEAVSIYGFRDQVEMMERKLKGIQCFLRDADRQSASNPSIEHWVNEMRDVAYEIEDVVDIFLAEVESYYHQKDLKGKVKKYAHKFQEMIDRRKIRFQIEKIDRNIEEITRRREQLGIQRTDEGGDMRRERLLQTRRRDACEERENDVVGLEKNIEELVERLLEGEGRLRVISVVGQAGLGKTVLARKAYNRAKSGFRPCAWIHVSKHEPKEVLRELCKAVLPLPGHEIEKLNEDEMPKRVADELKEKNYLVVLDDVWTTQTWDDIKRAFPNGRMESCVLMTTRDENVATRADRLTTPYRLSLLNDEDSYKLLCRNAFPSSPESCPQHLKALADNIVKRCGGLPLALVAVGRILSRTKQTTEAWKYFVDGFSRDLTQGNDEISSILALSFNYLHYDLKPCLLYCCAFLGASEIRVTRLLRLWIAEGFVERQENRIPEAVAMHYLAELVDRNLIQPCKQNSSGEIKSCRVHDILLAMLADTARKQKFFQIYSEPDHRDLSNYRRLAIHCSLQLKTCSLQKARSFIAFAESEPSIWHDQIQNFKLLRVLDLEGVKSVVTLPEEIGDLVLLRYLGLRHTSIEKLPRSTKKLYNLQTLDLRTSAAFRLSKSIVYSMKLKAKHVEKMANLRHLYFGSRSCGNSFNAMEVPDDFGVKGTLKELQTLSYVKAGGWVEKGLRTMTNLRKLGMLVTEGSSSKSVFEALPTLSHLHRLYLQGRLDGLLIDACKNLTKLTLDYSHISQGSFSMLQELESLKNLRLINNAFDGKIMRCSVGGFPGLEVLNLERLEKLEDMIVEPGAFRKLKYMRIASCNNLEKIPEGLPHVGSLQELRLIDAAGRLVERVQGADRKRLVRIQSITIATSAAESEFDVDQLN